MRRNGKPDSIRRKRQGRYLPNRTTIAKKLGIKPSQVFNYAISIAEYRKRYFMTKRAVRYKIGMRRVYAIRSFNRWWIIDYQKRGRT